MKTVLYLLSHIVLWLLYALPAAAQKQNDIRHYQFDTLSREGTGFLIQFKSYNQQHLEEDSRVYFYPNATQIKLPRFGRFLYFIKRYRIADSMVYDGLSCNYEPNGYYREEYYQQGKLSSRKFFDYNGQEIDIMTYKLDCRLLFNTPLPHEHNLFLHPRNKKKKTK